MFLIETMKTLGLALVFLPLSWGQKDPLNDFCRRFGQQSAVIDSKLYLDGGLVDWNPISQNPQNYTNTWLLDYDLTTSPANVGVPQLYANLSKNATIPDVSGGILWPDNVNKRFYLYGGDYNDISPNPPDLLSYDPIYNQWESFGTPGEAIQSVSWGGGVGISDLGQGYILGGWLSNNSVPNWQGGPVATSSLIKFEYDGGVWLNSTGPDNTPRVEGVMVYIPASEGGLLIYFGGATVPYGNDTLVESSMDTIYLYDIASARWYTQTAFGDVPASRRRFCAGAAWAPDQSSYNIYLYGGLGFGANASGFDDVYILSLPSFQWIHWWQGSPPGNPHHSMTCNVVNQGQMLVIGGTFPLSENCDSTPTWGTHNMDLGKSTGSIWHPYVLNITSYVVPPEIIAVVGGSSLGGATATAPVGGFNNSDLSVYFTQHASVASRTATRSIPIPTNSTTPTPNPQKGLSKGAIAGIAVGGVAFLAILFAGGCCIFRHRRNNQRQPPTRAEYNASPEYTFMAHQSPHGAYADHEPQDIRPYYQVHGNSIPAELAANNLHHIDPQKMTPRVDETEHPVYGGYNHQPSPLTTSPHPSSYSPVTENTGTHSSSFYRPQNSPAPTYSTTGLVRKPVKIHDTYYSP